MLKNKVRSIVAGCCAAALCLMSTTGAYAATSRSWSVHAQPGSYQTTQVVSIVNFGNGYVASCTAMSGDVASKSTTIREYSNSACTNAVALNKTVTFTDVNKSITFKHVFMPSVGLFWQNILVKNCPRHMKDFYYINITIMEKKFRQDTMQ